MALESNPESLYKDPVEDSKGYDEYDSAGQPAKESSPVSKYRLQLFLVNKLQYTLH